MLSGILAVITSLGGSMVMGVIKSFGETAMREYRGYLTDKMNSANEAEKIKMEGRIKEIDATIDARRNARDIRLATAHFWEMRVLTFLIALPFVIHLWLVFLDTVLETHWVIYSFPKPFDEWEGAILMSFFGLVGALGVGGQVAAAVAKGK